MSARKIHQQSNVTIKIIGSDDRKRVEKIWREVEQQVARPALVCTWDWVSTWIEYYGDIVEHWFCIGYVGQKAVGISIITKETKRYIPLPVKAYHLGTQGEPLKDWVHMVNNNVLVIAPYEQDFIDALASSVVTHFSWEEFLVDDAHSSFSASFKKAVAKLHLPVREVIQMCNIVDLDSIRTSGKTIIEYFSHDTRYQIRRNLREFEGLEVEYAETLDQALDIFDELIPLHQDLLQKKGKRGAFSSERFTRFHDALIKKIFHTGSIILFRAKSERLGTIGCFYLFNDNGTAFGYVCGLADFRDIEITTINKKRLKPGFVMHALCMQECLDRGISEYNFSVGNEPYKDELAPDYRPLVTIKVMKSYKSKLRESMYEAYIRADEQRKFQLLLKPAYNLYLLLSK